MPVIPSGGQVIPGAKRRVGYSPGATGTVVAPAAIATADATDPATTMALANESKAAFNDLRTALISAGVLSAA